MKKYILLAVLISGFSCTGVFTGAGKLTKPQNKTFYSRLNPKNALLLREDKTCYVQHEKFFFKSYSCTYRIDEDLLEIKFQDGTAIMGKIGENKITFGDEVFSDQPPATPKRF